MNMSDILQSGGGAVTVSAASIVATVDGSFQSTYSALTPLDFSGVSFTCGLASSALEFAYCDGTNVYLWGYQVASRTLCFAKAPLSTGVVTKLFERVCNANFASSTVAVVGCGMYGGNLWIAYSNQSSYTYFQTVNPATGAVVLAEFCPSALLGANRPVYFTFQVAGGKFVLVPAVDGSNNISGFIVVDISTGAQVAPWATFKAAMSMASDASVTTAGTSSYAGVMSGATYFFCYHDSTTPMKSMCGIKFNTTTGAVSGTVGPHATNASASPDGFIPMSLGVNDLAVCQLANGNNHYLHSYVQANGGGFSLADNYAGFGAGSHVHKRLSMFVGASAAKNSILVSSGLTQAYASTLQINSAGARCVARTDVAIDLLNPSTNAWRYHALFAAITGSGTLAYLGMSNLAGRTGFAASIDGGALTRLPSAVRTATFGTPSSGQYGAWRELAANVKFSTSIKLYATFGQIGSPSSVADVEGVWSATTAAMANSGTDYRYTVVS